MLEQFQLVGHQYVGDHSSIEGNTTLVVQPNNSVMLIYCFGRVSCWLVELALQAACLCVYSWFKDHVIAIHSMRVSI